MQKLVPAAFVIATLLLSPFCDRAIAGEASDQESAAVDVFNQRILPIFRSDEPSSCVQCHLASVDLKEYILPSHEKTFLSLRDQGLVDLDAPEDSKILTLIQMGEQDLDEGARLIHEKTRRAEYAAFAAWIKACCEDPRLRDLPPLESSERVGPAVSEPVIRHARKSRIVNSFARNVWSQRMRCFPCHTPYDIDESDARHQAAVKKQKEFQKQYPHLVERMQIFRETPEQTLQYLIERSREPEGDALPLLNLETPRESLLVLKPMSKLPPRQEDGQFAPPSSVDPVSHMGGLKMHGNDQSYKSFVTWIQDYANVVEGHYTSVDQLPADNWVPTNLIVRLQDAPAEWPVGATAQLFVHAWDEQSDSWSDDPIAFTQGTVTPRHMINGALFLLSTADSVANAENGSLPRGRYLVKTYLDGEHRLDKDPSLLLSESDFGGQAEIPKARWREGFRSAETVSGKDLTIPDSPGVVSK